MEDQVTALDVESRYPELEWIEKKELRDQCRKAFVMAYEAGGWTREQIDQVPVSIVRVKQTEMNRQVDHVRVVTAIAVDMYDKLEQIYRRDTGLRDVIIAGALLHDLGKMTEFTWTGNGATYSPGAKLIRHPLSGALLAAKAGICQEVIHIIATHSFEGKDSYHSLASMIVKAADDIAFQYITHFE